MPMTRVLVAEDDPAVRTAVTRVLELEGYQVSSVNDGAAALAFITDTPPDAVVMDVMMPFADGFTVCREARMRGSRVPILLLTAKHEVSDRVAGLDAGADDYLVKPFDLPELLARLRALRRRLAGRVDDTVSLGELELDVANHELRFRGERVSLSPRELALTELLMQKAGRVVTKDSIVARLSSWEADFSENSVEVYVHRLRKRFVELGVVIKTVRGFGYVMEVAETGPAPAA